MGRISSFFGNVLSDYIPKEGEIASSIAKNVLKKSGMNTSGKILTSDGSKLMRERIEAISKRFLNKEGTNVEEAMMQSIDTLGTVTKLATGIYKNQGLNLDKAQKSLVSSLGIFNGEYARSYFLDNPHSKKRIVTAAGLYGAGTLATRYISGGNIAENSKGEADIAGIPFI